MKAWLLDEQTGIERLRLGETPEPVVQPGEAVLALHYAALNPADRYLAERQYPARPTLPHILGRDGMGTVIATGRDTIAVAAGQHRAILRGEVGVNRAGTFAQRVAVPVEYLVEIPAGWSEPEAAGATLVYLTAYQALTMWGPLPPGSAVLVTGASGGVGVASVQLGTALGYKVIGLSRSAEKGRRLESLGAAAIFDSKDPQWRHDLKAMVGPSGVALALDNIGGRLLPEVIDTLGDLGKVSLIGRLAGPVPEFNTATMFFRRLRLGGVAVGAYTTAETRAAWLEVVSLLAQIRQRPLVDSVFPFEALPQAFARLAEGPLGKVVLQVKP